MAAISTGVYHRSYGAELALRHTVVERVRLTLAVAALLVLPFVASPFWLTVANQVGIAVVGAIGLNILTGYTGQISLGQGGFLAVGAYTSGLLVVRLGVPTLAAVLIAVLFTAAVGAVFGLPALRLKGLYLAIATLASQFIILWVVRNWTVVTGGVDSLVVPRSAIRPCVATSPGIG
jgi:branched-chain amino acid transport system permease protein